MAIYFSFAELTRSVEAARLGIDNTPPPAAMLALDELAVQLLDPLREMWNAPITINSGYRCPALNKAVGGAPSSHHLTGHAADITTGSRKGNRLLFDLIAAGTLEFCQMIDERSYLWLHISYRKGSNQRKILHL